jgi:hypothetical protein
MTDVSEVISTSIIRMMHIALAMDAVSVFTILRCPASYSVTHFVTGSVTERLTAVQSTGESVTSQSVIPYFCVGRLTRTTIFVAMSQFTTPKTRLVEPSAVSYSRNCSTIRHRLMTARHSPLMIVILQLAYLQPQATLDTGPWQSCRRGGVQGGCRHLLRPQ